MICSTIYEFGTITDINEEDFSSTSNNNERNGSYIDRNMPQDHRISMSRHAEKETAEKNSKDAGKDIYPAPLKKEEG